ncbi:MAG: hypothetical protein IKU26_07545 [Clostridia bacterium]|nr:hypothetical protein [Clostridia bacterium]
MQNKQCNIRPDTWTAVDGLGRTISDYSVAGEKRKDKFVGLLFWNWHDYFSYTIPRNVSKVLEQYPEARNDFNHPGWEGTPEWTPYFWNEPIWGYYKTSDDYVLRKQVELIANAGIDMVFIDLTNGSETFPTGYEAIFQAFEAAKQDGIKVPKISFFLNPYLNPTDERNMVIQLTDLYETIYKAGRYQDLWFYWEGKPMMMARWDILNEEEPTEKAMKEFFTFRQVGMGYYAADTDISEKTWGWCSVYPQTKFGVRKDGSVEQMCVSVAQNADKNFTDITYTVYDMVNALVCMNDYQDRALGRGRTKGDYAYQYTYGGKTITIDNNTQDAFVYGLNFQQQWDRVLEQDPDFVFVTGWNEFVAQRRLEWQGTEGGFPDNFDDAFSRDIEPTKGILKDHFYYQLVNNIRKFKGVSKLETSGSVQKTMDITASGDQWADIDLSYDYYTGCTRERKCAGYVGIEYDYNTMRNEIVTAKVAYDQEYIYFMAETKEDLTPSSDPAWMRLLLDTDPTGVSPNWEGFEYIINRVSPNGDEAVIEKSVGGWNFEQVGTAKFSVSGKMLQIAVPRRAVGLAGENDVKFSFKWADNTVTPEDGVDSGDILDFYRYGSVVPGGRFAFVFNTEVLK